MVVSLFRYADDPYVNIGAAEIARRLQTDGFDITVEPYRICIAEADIASACARLEEYFFGDTGYVTRTHRRSSDAHRVNAYLRWINDVDNVADLDDGRHIPPSKVPLATEEQTVFDDDDLSLPNLEEQGINTDELPDKYSGHGAYSLAPTYGGNPNSRGFSGALKRARFYLDVFTGALTDSNVVNYEVDAHCMICGGAQFPNWEAEHEEHSKSHIEYGQSFSPAPSKSGRLKPMGASNSANSYFRGRCVACLISGFAYIFMTKPFAPTGDSGVYRWFAPVSDFKRLVEYRIRFMSETRQHGDWPVDAPYINSNKKGADSASIRMSLFGTSQTHSPGMQVLAFYHELLDTFERSVGGLRAGSELDFPTTISTFTSNPRKSGNPIRGFGSFDRIEDGEWLVALLADRERSLPKKQAEQTGLDTEPYSPFEDVLLWFANIDDPSMADESHIDAKNDLAYGLINRDLGRTARGLTGLHKGLSNAAEAASYPLSGHRASHYFNSVLTDMTDLDPDTVESITSVARNVGQTFANRENISVIMKFKNANTPSQFLNALERAGVDGLKMAQQGAAGSDSEADERALKNVPYYEDVETLIKALSEDFKDVKHIFVAQAAISGQYVISNTASSADSDNSSGSSDAVEGE